MNKEVSQETATTKYLAVVIVNKLTCKDHINQTTYKILAKLLQNLGQLSSPKLTAKKGVLRKGGFPLKRIRRRIRQLDIFPLFS